MPLQYFIISLSLSISLASSLSLVLPPSLSLPPPSLRPLSPFSLAACLWCPLSLSLLDQTSLQEVSLNLWPRRPERFVVCFGPVLCAIRQPNTQKTYNFQSVEKSGVLFIEISPSVARPSGVAIACRQRASDSDAVCDSLCTNTTSVQQRYVCVLRAYTEMACAAVNIYAIYCNVNICIYDII